MKDIPVQCIHVKHNECINAQPLFQIAEIRLLLNPLAVLLPVEQLDLLVVDPTMAISPVDQTPVL